MRDAGSERGHRCVLIVQSCPLISVWIFNFDHVHGARVDGVQEVAASGLMDGDEDGKERS